MIDKRDYLCRSESGESTESSEQQMSIKVKRKKKKRNENDGDEKKECKGDELKC